MTARWRAAGGGVALVLGVAACGSGAGSAPEVDVLRAVPPPMLGAVAEPARAQLARVHAEYLSRADDEMRPISERAAAYGTLGRYFLAASLPAVAEPALLNARALATTDARWPHYLGHLYRERGDMAEASAMFEEAARLDASDVAALVWLGRLHLDLDQPTAAEEAFTRALAVTPDSMAARLGLGRAALARGEFARAVVELERVVEAAPRAAAATYALGLAYRGLGDEARAREVLAVRGDVDVDLLRDPLVESLSRLLDSAQAYETRGLASLEEGAWTDAAAQFRLGLAIVPPDNVDQRASLMHKLGTALWLGGDVEAAEAQFEAGIEVMPALPLNYFSLGLIEASRDRFDAARQSFEQAIARDADYVEARVALGDVLLELGRPETAVSHFARALEVAPDSAEALISYAAALAELGRLGEARRALLDGMRRHPEDPRFVNGLNIIGFGAGSTGAERGSGGW